ncbi:MAG: BACON domain-containing protein [Phycisphaerae bacterium]
MGSPQNCTTIQATLCPGYTGTSPLWVSKSLLSGSFLGSGGSFAYNGACYSIPANAQPQTPTGGGYASAAYMGDTFSNCSACCAAEIHPAYLSFCPPSGGSYTVQIQYGPPNAAFTAAASSTGNWLSVSPTSGNLSSSGSATLTVTAQPITDGPQGGTVTVDVTGCPEPLVVSVDDSNIPSSCPSGLIASYKLGGAYPTVGDQGVQIATTVDCPSVEVAPFNGLVTVPSGGGCLWFACNPPPPCPILEWGSYIIGGVSIILANNEWNLVIGDEIPVGCANTQVSTYTKACGSTPRGVYKAVQSATQPQTLYVE